MPDAAERLADLEIELRRRDDKIKELTAERDEALATTTRMREHIEDVGDNLQRWIDVFQMQQNDAGTWLFDPEQTSLWDDYLDLSKRYDELIREWNKFVPEYNAVIEPRDIGRPLAAS